MTGLDLDHVRHWLERIHGDAPGRLVVNHMTGGKFAGTGGDVPDLDAAAERIHHLDERGAGSIYLRTTTVDRQLGQHERGGADDAHALPGLWADVDYGDEGHKPNPTNPFPLPPDADAARAIIDSSGLPAPTLWVHSGGGLYPWWLLDRPAVLDDQTRPVAASLSSGWQKIIERSAHRLGYDYGAGVGDLARVLRVPGTVNRKTSNARPCRLIEDTGVAYTLDELVNAATALSEPERPRQAPPAPTRVNGTGSGAFDALDEHVTFGDLLTGAGWVEHHGRHSPAIEQCWTRPGDPDHPCSAHTLTAQPHVLVVFSELAGLPTGGGQRLTRGRVFAHLHHGGDERAAALDLYDAMNGRPSSGAAAALPLPRTADTAGVSQSQVSDDLRDNNEMRSSAQNVGTDDDVIDAEAGEDEPGSSWAEVDLSDVIDGVIAGTITRPSPAIGKRGDGAGLFYRGRVNGVAGASNAGKSWTGFLTAAQEMTAGEHVVYVDLEDDQEGAVTRLLDLGVPPDIIRERFHYVRPAEAFGVFGSARFAALLDHVAPSLVVIDSTGESLALEGAKPNDDDDVARWFRRMPTGIARRCGAAVIVLDHVTKAEDGGLWPIGSQRKRAAITGAQYMQVNVKAFDRTTTGYSKLVCAKDRHGNYHQGQTVALLHVDPHAEGVDLELRAPAEAGSSGVGSWRPTALMERVSRALEGAGEPLGVRALDRAVKGKKEHKQLATDLLVQSGHVAVESGRNRAVLHKMVRPYRQADDPLSDLYRGPGDTEASSDPKNGVCGVPVPKKGDGGHTPQVSPGDTRGTPGDTEPVEDPPAVVADLDEPTCPSCGGPIEATRAALGYACLSCKEAS